MKPRCCNKKITASLVIRTSSMVFLKAGMSSKYMTILIVSLLKIDIETFRSFIKFQGAGPKPKQANKPV